jgi:phage tail-like protein
MNPLQLHDRTAFKPVTLKRGVIAQPAANDFGVWANAAYVAITDYEANHQYRRDMVIEHLTRESNVAKRYTMFNCVPVTYEPGSDFSAVDDGGISIESISFLYEGFEEETFDTRSQFSYTDILKTF